ncbi:DJ-1/PfpI family protein [Mycoplasma sp. 4463]|uniref:DJ-1/PfpI family protein n=1 Tax=Mycoplasma sp. 4463 TaxID=3400998 RepID=UPI003AAD83A4
MKLLVIIEDKFNDIELNTTLSVLVASGKLESITYYSPNLKEASGQFNIVKITNIVNSVNLNEFDLMFVPGGRGCQTLRQNQQSLELINKFFNDLNKPLAAICDAPNVLAEFNIIKDQKYVSFFSEWSKPFWKDGKIINFNNWKQSPFTNIDRNLITASNATASLDFGFAILEYFYGEDFSDTVRSNMTFGKLTQI